MSAGLKQRLQSFDWLRGVAVVFMLQTHSVMFLLDPKLKGTGLYRVLLRLDGLVAPSFIFSAGFSLALVQVRAAAGPSGRAARVGKTLRRLLEVLAVATLVNWCWFPVFREPRWLLRLDILHCIGLSLLLSLPLMTLLARRPGVLRWVTLALAVGCFAATGPLADAQGWLSLFVNQKSGAMFPLLPWAGYVYLGASAGATAAQGELGALVRWLALLLGLGLGLWAGLGLDHPQRVAWVAALVLALLLVEHRLPGAAATLPFRAMTVLGQSSLAAYFLHEVLLFYGVWWAFALGLLVAWRLPARWAWLPLCLSPALAWRYAYRAPGLSLADFWRDRADWPTYGLLLAGLLGATYALVVVTDEVYRKLDRLLSQRRSQQPMSGPAPASRP